MTRALLVLGLVLLLFVGCKRGVCGNDDDMEPPVDDDSAGGDDDTTAGDDDDETAGDDDDFAPCDDDTADGTWIAAYGGSVELEVAAAAGSTWSLSCDAHATMAGHAHSFSGQIDCADPSFAATPLTLEGQKSGGDSCIDGEIGGEIADLGPVAWPWIGTITPDNVTGHVGIGTEHLTVLCDFDLAALPLALVWVNPDTGYVTGGIHVTLTGDGFTAADDMTVWFGDRQATPTDQCGGSSECEVAIPAADQAGPVDVTVTNSNGTVTLPASFTYL
jgi:hypothetical protein